MSFSEMGDQHTVHRIPEITGDADSLSGRFTPQDLRHSLIYHFDLAPIQPQCLHFSPCFYLFLGTGHRSLFLLSQTPSTPILNQVQGKAPNPLIIRNLKI
jgi:hypothetical protein